MRDLRFFAPRKPIEPASDGYNWIYYYVEDISSPTMLMNYVGTIDGGYVIVDGVRISNIGSGNRKINYTFSKPGIHLLKYKESEGGGYNRFRGCSTIVEAYLCKLTGTITGPFANCSQLAKVELPDDLTELNISSVFSNCYSLSFNTKNVTTVTGTGWTGGVRVEMPNVESIPQNFCRASAGNQTLEYIDIGPNILTIGGTAFFGCTALTIIICRAEIPPTWPTGDPFYRLDTDYHIYVPYTSNHSMLNTYKTATGWSNYASRIYELCADDSIPIIFEDPIVEQICVDNFTNNNGHVSYEDAAKVTNTQFGTLFSGNTQITSFNELQYFTGLTYLNAAFEGCSSLKSVVLPPSLTELRGYAFVDCAALETIVLSDNLISISNLCFARCYALHDITIPSLVTNIGNQAFLRCSGLVNLVVLPPAPPSLGSALLNAANNASIYVPYSSDHSILSAYQTAQNWSGYASRIYELNPDGTIPTT